MTYPKIENLLQLSSQTEDSIRSRIPDMEAGFFAFDNTWEVVVKSVGDLGYLKEKYASASFTELLCGYMIITASYEDVERLSDEPDIIYIEKPRAMYFEMYTAKSEACVNAARSVTNSYGGVSGNGVLICIIDSGIDILNQEFINKNGATRIKYLWDQGTDMEYDEREINELISDYRAGVSGYVPGADDTGHGNDVAVIACGNSGVAPGADIVVVKLANSRGRAFTRTTQLMRGLDYCIRKAVELGQPAAVNISYGGNYGDHCGNSVFETFIDDCCSVYRCSVCIGAGNEGEGRTHCNAVLTQGVTCVAELAVGSYEPQINIQIWKNYADTCAIELELPSGERITVSQKSAGAQKFAVSGMTVIYNSYAPSPYNMLEETYIAAAANNGFIESGVWKLRFTPVNIVDGTVNMWLPPAATLNASTGFLEATPECTFTIPSTSRRAICVGASGNVPNSAAAYSGRGFTVNNGLMRYAKPDIIAPGTDILIPSSGDNNTVTGTSYAAPMVTGAAALMMEWGIVKGFDSEMYGEKLKACLIRGATRVGAAWPDSDKGWGELCVFRSLL